jgi:hypothetical protein
MANNQIDVTIRATNETNQGIADAKRNIEQFKSTQQQAMVAHREEIHRARGAAELLGQTLGIHIPRELRGIMASTSLVGGAMAAAFAPAAILALIPVVTQLVGKITEISDAFDESASKAEDFGAAAQKAMRDTVEVAKASRDAIRAGELLGLNPQEQALERSQWKRDEASKLESQILFRRQQLADLLKEKTELPREQLVTGVGVTIKAPASVVPAFDTAKAIKVVQTEINNLLDQQRTLLKEADNTWQSYKDTGTTASKAVAAATDDTVKSTVKLLDNFHKITDTKADAQIRAIDEAITQASQVQRDHPEAYSLANEMIARLMTARAEIVKQQNNAIIDSMRQTDVQMLKGLDELMRGLEKEKTLPKYGDTLLRPGETVGQDKNLMLISSAPKFDEMSAQMKTIKAISQEVGDGFSNIFAEMIDGTHSVSEAFANMAKAVAASIASMIAKMVIMAAVERIIGSIAGAFGWGGGSGASVSSANWNVGQFQFAGARAGGGPVSANMPYLIGERGPELFVPNSSGSVVPNGGFGGSNVQVNIINETGSQVRKSESAPQFDGTKWVQNIILQDVSSNGPIGQMLRGRR